MVVVLNSTQLRPIPRHHPAQPTFHSISVMALKQRLSACLLVVMFYCAATATTAGDTSPLQIRKLRSTEGTFIRGMMAADHQFDLYVTMKCDQETSSTRRCGDDVAGRSVSSRDEKKDVMSVSRGGGSSSRSGGGSHHRVTTHMRHSADHAQDMTVNFIDIVRRRALFQSRRSP